jgi:hypothetical protein
VGRAEAVSLEYSCLSPETAKQYLSKAGSGNYYIHAAQPEELPATMTSSVKHGTTCPRCGKAMVNTGWGSSSDGFCGVYSDIWTCTDPECGISRNFNIESYHSYNE